LKRVLILLVSLLSATLISLSCGSSPQSTSRTTGVKYRAFLSNNVSAGTGFAGVYLVDAEKDVRAAASPISAGNTPGMMLVTPNKGLTLVFSGSGTQTSDNQLSFINNSNETLAGHVILPGMTESFVASPDSSSGYAAVPTAPVVGQSPGVVSAFSLLSGAFTGEVDVPAVRYLSIDNGGNRIFGFSGNSDQIAVITPSNIQIGNAVTYIGGTGIFDRPVAAFFTSDDSTAYVLSCGAECGGTQAGVQKYDLNTNTVTASIPVPAATEALLNGSTMYVAGTPPGQPCTGQTTAAQTCGVLTIVDLGTMTVSNPSPIIITDGYHNRIALGANGQLFIGARTCTEIILPIPPAAGDEARGCLSIYNTLGVSVGTVSAGGVIIPPVTGDVTGIEPIAIRSVVYVVQGQSVQGGTLYIYDTSTDALETAPPGSNNPGQIFGLVGNFVDVKTVDF
jgi:hypothetical protein